MKKLFLTFFVVAVLTAGTVIAQTFPIGAQPGNIRPKIYLIDKFFDWGLDDALLGGSTPGNFPQSMEGSITPQSHLRDGFYAFTGEQVSELVIARDLNGAADLSYAKVIVANLTEALCTGLVVNSSNVTLGNGQQVELPSDVPPADDATDEPGYNATFDKVYECMWTVEPTWYEEWLVNIEVYDQSGSSSTDGIAQNWFFNPIVIVDLKTNNGAPSVMFYDGVPGETVYSTNKLMIKNLAEDGIDLRVWIGATDLTDSGNSGALCPYSNVLDTDAMYSGLGNWGMEYRGNKGTYIGSWHPISNKNAGGNCTFAAGGLCRELQDVVWGGNTDTQIVGPNGYFEVEFRLTYPVPCIGNFSDGNVEVIVMAV